MDEEVTETPSTMTRDVTINVSDVFLFLLALGLAAFITSANAMTIVAIWRTPALRTLANMYVCSLACADVTVGAACVVLALFMLPPLRDKWFDKSNILCALLNGLNIGMTSVSAFNMTLIALDRYLYIIRPYFYQRAINIRVISILISAAWAAGLVLAFLPQFIARSSSEVPLCDITERLPVWYLFYLVSVLYLLTCGVNIVLYSVILRAASRQRKAVAANLTGPACTHQTGKTEQGKSGGNPQNISKGTMKSLKFFLTVFGFFFCCITPMVVVLALDNYVNVLGIVYRLLNLIALLNSAMNFLIYAVMNKQFRQAFLRTSALGKICGSRCLRLDDGGGGGGGEESAARRTSMPRTGGMVTSYTDVEHVPA